VSDAVQRVKDAVEAFAQISDPADRARELSGLLSGLPDIHRRIRELRQEAVLELRAGGATQLEVGRVLGVTKARARQIELGMTSGRPKRDDG